jgi:hypothetical protein
MLTGLEVGAAICTIIGTFTACAKLVREYKRKRRENSNSLTGDELLDKIERLGRLLSGGRSAVEDEFNRQRGIRGTVMDVGDRTYEDL